MHEFQFSQASLQDYLACPRRFQLRYIIRQPWPAQAAQPEDAFELHLQQGASLHRLIQQDFLGTPREKLTQLAQDQPLSTWWTRYLEYSPADLPDKKIPEVELSATIGENRLVGKFDLLAFEPGGRFVIVDWKTERNPPRREQLVSRMQTVLYPFLLVEGGADYNRGEMIDPAQVEMIYWFTELPQNPQSFLYDLETHQSNRSRLENLLAEIQDHQEEIFPLTRDELRCTYCNYRSLCKRGSKAGSFVQIEGDPADIDPYFDLELETLSEISF